MPKKATKSTSPVPPSIKGLDPQSPKLTKALLERLYYVRNERKRLEAEARSYQTEENILRDVVYAWFEEMSIHQVVKFGFRVAQVYGRVVVPWKEAFIREVGKERADALAASSPKCQSLEIEPVK